MKKKIAILLAGLLALAVTINPDSYDKLFVKANGTGASFVDSSTSNPKTITANGNATQLSLHDDFAGKRTAGFFNGSTDYVVVPDSDNWDFGTGNFSIKLYANFSSTANQFLVHGLTDKFAVQYSGTALRGMIAGTYYAYTWTPTLNTWYKIEWKRTSGATSLLIDDVEVDADTNSDNAASVTGVNIGAYTSGNNHFSGWIKNLTITKAGTTVLDMKFDSPATSPLGPAIYFDGTGDYLQLANSSDWNFGTGDFTLECQVRFNTVGGATRIISRFGDDRFSIKKEVGGGLSLYVNGSAVVDNKAWSPSANIWYHITAGRTSGTSWYAINGQWAAGNASSQNTTGSETLEIGGTTGGFDGWIREVRISNVGRYSASFTPSQTGFTVDSNTKLYIKGNQDNGTAGTSILDSTGKAVTCAGDAKIKYTEDYRSCIFKDETGKFPYPQGSAKVDFFAIGSGAYWGNTAGTGYLSIADSDDWDMTTFTVEGYIRPTANNTWESILAPGNGAVYNTWLALMLQDSATTNNLNCLVESTTIKGSFNRVANTWYHLAMSRDSSNDVRIFLNGTVLNTANISTAIASNDGVNIGRMYSGGSYYYTSGLMDNIRISKGVARYTAAFNPPEDVPQTGSKRKKASSWWFFF